MSKKFLICLLAGFFILGFLVGYIWQSYDVYKEPGNTWSFWKILSPI